METVKGYSVCSNCKFSSLHTCHKYNKTCLSVNFNGKRYQLACNDCLDVDGFEFGDYQAETDTKKIGYFHLPGPENLHLFRSLMMLYKYYPEMFYNNRRVSEIYGNFPGATWNGRTPDYGGMTLSIQDLDRIRQEIEELGLSLNLTFNNHLIEERDLFDRWCNSIAEVFHNGKHAITVASPLLFNYLKDTYPNYKYYQSVIQTELDKEFMKKDEGYHIYLMNRKLNNNWDELLKVPENDRDKIEFLCNDACTPICYRQGHYNVVNACLLKRSDESCLGNYCTIDHDFMRFNADRWPMTITTNHIDKYIENGFVHFKLCSRGDNGPILIYKIIQYLIKPEYVDDALIWCCDETLVNEEGRKLNVNSN